MYARYTEYLRDLMNNPEARQALDKALSTYPLYQGKKVYDLIPSREELNTKLLNHYKYREIGFETPGRFFDELEITMNEIMPYYNEMYKTVEIMADLESPFDNVDVTETFEQTRSDTSESEGTTTSSNTANSTTNSTNTQNGTSSETNHAESEIEGSETNTRKHSDTPQNAIDDIDRYLSEYTKEDKTQTQSSTSDSTSTSSNNSSMNAEGTAKSETEGEESSSSSTSSTGTVSHTFKKKGNQGVNTYAHDMNEFRTSIIDITNQIINDERINELFMFVW